MLLEVCLAGRKKRRTKKKNQQELSSGNFNICDKI